MKRFFHLLGFMLFFLLAASCSRHTIIPDKELARIFHDAFLTNAYIGNGNLRIDSLNVYEPIFARYGYTTADVQYTIGNFSKRKSARLGDVVEAAIKQLEAEGKYYDKEVAVLDTIDNVARRLFTRTIHADSLIRVRSLRDTARLRFNFDDLQPGEYNLSMKYRVDSLDKNNGLKASTWLVKRDSTRSNVYTFTLRRDRTENFSRRFTVDSTIRGLRLDFFDFKEKPQRPSVTLSDFEIRYTPQTQAAVESLYMKQLDIRIFADEFLRAAKSNPTDSL